MTSGVRGATVAVATAAVMLAAGGAALSAVGARQLSHRAETSSVQSRALSAGRQFAVDLAAYDYRQLDQDFARVSAESTGAFRTNYQKQAAGLQDLITKAKAVSTAEVAGAGVVDSTPSRATVIVALNRTVKNTSVPKGQSDSFGLKLALQNVHGRWLISQVTPL